MIGFAAQAPLYGKAARRGLDVYLIDVEGGAATLIVTPAGQAVLIDAGWHTKTLRDSKRVMAAMRSAGVVRLDYLLVSHYHSDHLGGVVELAPHVSVGEFLDHGLMEKPLPYVSPELYSDYVKLSKGHRRAVKPGERITLRSEHGGPEPSLFVLASNGVTLTQAGGKPNPVCASAQTGPSDEGENANSVGVVLEFGKFRYLAGADLPWDEEMHLVCPTNQIGAVNVYQVDHHGKSTSNNPVLIESIDPQVALTNNGPDKAGDASVFHRLRKELNLADIYQIHRNLRTGDADNASPENTANPGTLDGGFGLQVHVSADGSLYEVINERTHKARRYFTRH